MDRAPVAKDKEAANAKILADVVSLVESFNESCDELVFEKRNNHLLDARSYALSILLGIEAHMSFFEKGNWDKFYKERTVDCTECGNRTELDFKIISTCKKCTE